jgi:CheY-like chemotaxis protein
MSLDSETIHADPREDPRRKATILIVDDDDDLRGSLCESLADEGYDVVGVAHGGEALEYLRRAPPPRMILLDLAMPVMNGWQFRAAQQSDPVIAGIPVVVLTAETSSRRGTLNVDELIPKPISLDRLLSVVVDYCG